MNRHRPPCHLQWVRTGLFVEWSSAGGMGTRTQGQGEGPGGSQGSPGEALRCCSRGGGKGCGKGPLCQLEVQASCPAPLKGTESQSVMKARPFKLCPSPVLITREVLRNLGRKPQDRHLSHTPGRGVWAACWLAGKPTTVCRSRDRSRRRPAEMEKAQAPSLCVQRLK